MHEIPTPRLADDPGDLEDAGHLRFRELARGEQLTLWSLRAIALGQTDCPTLQRALQVALGSSAEEVFTSLFVSVRTLGWCARRRLRLHAPGCERVSADEQSLLALFAAAQHALVSGDERHMRERLEMLIQPPMIEGLSMMLQTVTSALEVNGYPLRGHRRVSVGDRRLLH